MLCHIQDAHKTLGFFNNLYTHAVPFQDAETNPTRRWAFGTQVLTHPELTNKTNSGPNCGRIKGRLMNELKVELWAN